METTETKAIYRDLAIETFREAKDLDSDETELLASETLERLQAIEEDFFLLGLGAWEEE